IVNTARGGIVDEVALIEALKSGKVSAAGLDVFESEPLPADHPFLGMDQVILSPHIAGLTREAAERMAIGSARNILDFFNGTLDPALVVNREQLAHD
ncbi:MAG: 3-phosphoglycerate dehydrogenase, partial [Silicimonas sp.]|nr:3-phosphoglycerate dehydrogenase [Silicimonas sp.]